MLSLDKLRVIALLLPLLLLLLRLLLPLVVKLSIPREALSLV